MLLKKLYILLFFLGIFFIPFNEFEGWTVLGEYSDEAATYFFLSAFILMLTDSLSKGKIGIPYKNSVSLFLIGFLIWSAVSTLINFETVSANFFKGISGFNRYIRQTFSLVISAVVFTILFWNVIKDYTVERIFKLIRKVILFSFIFVSVYGFIEIGIVFFHMGFLKPVLKSFEVFPFVNTFLHDSESRRGISSVTFEIPALGTYLIMVLPWMASYIYTEKSLLKYLPLATILILLFFSDSRSALIVISVQLLAMFFLFVSDLRFRANTLKIAKYGMILILGLLIWKSESIYETIEEKSDRLNFSKNLTENVSNKSRFGMQYATLQVFKENPITGVGLGQVAYHSINHYPYWATVNNYEFDLYYKNQQVKSFPPNYNFYTRILAELGIVGIFLLLSLFFLCTYYSYLYWKLTTNKFRFVGVILFLSFVGVSINWMQLDYFRQYGFWLCLVLLIKARADFKKDREESLKLSE